MTKAAGSGTDFALEKSLPSNLEAERLILGAVLLDNSTINQAAERLKRDDFFLDSHRRIYDRMLHLSETGRAIDPITLGEELQRAGELNQIGGMAYISSLFDGVPRFSNIESYVNIVKGKSILRRLITNSNQIMAMCFDAEDEPEEVLDQAEKMIFAIAEDRIRQGFTPIREIAHKQFEHIEEIAGKQQLITGIATGFRDLDYMTSGLQRGDLIIVAARPSMGKCLSADSEIVMADGSLATIEDICRRRQTRLLTLNDNWRFSLTEPSAFVDDGMKPVLRVTTRLGRRVESTLPHPYLTLDGWRRLEELKPGDRIAVPRTISVFGTEELSDGQVKFLADSLRDDSDAHNKTIPPIVFRLTKPKLALFLNRLFANDGWVAMTGDYAVESREARCESGLHRRGTEYAETAQRSLSFSALSQLSLCLCGEGGFLNTSFGFAPAQGSYATPSERLARQVQHLLLRFGIIAKLRRKQVKQEDCCRTSWQLDIQPPSELAASDVYWDEIISIEPLGLKRVYDLTIPDTHNFVANDICVHNTAFSLNMAQNAALMEQQHGGKAVVGVFSLEMSKEQLVQRMMCSQARLDAHRLRSGMLSKDDWRRLAQAVGELAEANIFIDDTPSISSLELRAKSRRLKQEQHGLDLLIVDYLQLMSGRGRVESRQQEVSQISRELKGIAKELNVPLIALSQLSRATESRTDHRPQLSDLRESGCLAGESLVTLADSGARVPIRDLTGRSGFDVWALNEATMRLERANVSRAFATGVKPVFRLTTRLGRMIRATANHKFRTFDGWKRLDELRTGELMALPRQLESGDFQSMTDAELALLGHLIGDGCTLPRHAIQYTTREKDLAETVAALTKEVFGGEVEPRIKQERTWYQVYLSSTRHHTHHIRSAVTEWMMKLGVWGLRSYEKRVPEKVFEQTPGAIALFLRHLWATDGTIRVDEKRGKHHPGVCYATSSEPLARDVQSLLLRIAINATLRRAPQPGKGRDQYHVTVSGRTDIESFVKTVGATGARRTETLRKLHHFILNTTANANRDVIPSAVWRQYVVPSIEKHGLTTREMMAGIRSAYCGTGIYKKNLSRERAARIAGVVHSVELLRLANSDVYWDQILSIVPDGVAEVFDLTVDEHHNFVVNDSISHNSLEQDADVVMFIYRDEVYHPETEKQNTAEIIIGKQRNGPIGSLELIFLKQLTRFENKAYEG